MRISRPLRDWSSCPLYPALVRRGTFVLIVYSLYAPNRTGLLSGRPRSTSSGQALRDFVLQTAVTTPGLERNEPSTGLCACDPALDQQSGKARTNVEAPAYGLKAVPFKMHAVV